MPPVVVMTEFSWQLYGTIVSPLGWWISPEDTPNIMGYLLIPVVSLQKE